MDNKRKCSHGFYLDSNGKHISTPEKSTAELIAEAQKIIEYNTEAQKLFPKNTAISMNEAAKLYQEDKPPAATKPENQVKKFKDMVNEGKRLASEYEKPSPLDMPKETLTSMSESIKKYFYEYEKRNKNEQQETNK